MKVKASECFFDIVNGTLRRPTDTFEASPERASFLSEKGLIEPVKQATSQKKKTKE